MYVDPSGHAEVNDSKINKTTEAGKDALAAIAKASKAYTIAQAVNDTKAMEKAHQAAEDARREYAQKSQDLKYIEAKYGTDRQCPKFCVNSEIIHFFNNRMSDFFWHPVISTLSLEFL